MPLRARAIILYWIAQAIVLLAAVPVLVEPDPRLWLSSARDVLRSREYLAYVGVFTVGLMCAQAAMVRPVLPPSARRGRCGAAWALAGHAASAAALSFGLSVVLMLTLAVFWDFGRIEIGLQYGLGPEALCVMVFGAGTLVLTPVLARKCRDGAPVWLSLLIAGLAIAAMVTGMSLAIFEGVEVIRGRDLDDDVMRWSFFLPVAITWPVATPLLIAFVRRGDRDSRLARVASMIFLGTVVETAAVIPLDVVVRKRSTCYCGEGTYWSLVLLGSVGLLALGPAVYLLPMARRRRRWLGGRCEVCGYDMKATPRAQRCPECGAGWRAPA